MAGQHAVLHSRSDNILAGEKVRSGSAKKTVDKFMPKFRDIILKKSQTGSVSCTDFSPVVRLVNYENSIMDKRKSAIMEQVASGSPSHLGSKQSNGSNAMEFAQNSLFTELSVGNDTTAVCLQTEILSSAHDLSDESGIEEPELPPSVPAVEQEASVTTRRSSQGSLCTDSGSESPDATNIIPSPPLDVEAALCDKSMCHGSDEHSTCSHTQDVKVVVCEDGPMPSPSMPCLEMEMPILTKEEPVSLTDDDQCDDQASSTLPDSSDAVAAKSISTRSLFCQDFELTTIVTSTSDETPDDLFENAKTEMKSEHFDSCTSGDEFHDATENFFPGQNLQLQARSPPKNFLTEFNKFIKKFDARKVVKSVSEEKVFIVEDKSNGHKRAPKPNINKTKKKYKQATTGKSVIGESIKTTKQKCKPTVQAATTKKKQSTNTLKKQPAATEKEEPTVTKVDQATIQATASPGRRKQKSFHHEFVDITEHRAPLYFTPQNLYEMFINAYWSEHYCDHATKDEVVRDADRLWKHGYSLEADPGHTKLLEFLDRHNEKSEKRSAKTHGSSAASACVRRRSTDSHHRSVADNKLKYKRRASVDSSVVKEMRTKAEEETKEDKEVSYKVADVDRQTQRPRPKRRRISNMKYDADEFAVGDMSELDDIAETAEAVTDQQMDDVVRTLCEADVDALYAGWRPPAHIHVGDLLANMTLLWSLKHKVVELLRIVFPALDYPSHLLTSEDSLRQLMGSIEAAVTDKPAVKHTPTVTDMSAKTGTDDPSVINTPGVTHKQDACISDTAATSSMAGETAGRTDTDRQSAACQVVLCKHPARCLRRLRAEVCAFLCVILPDLSLDPAFDRTSDSVEELLAEIVTSNKQAMAAESVEDGDSVQLLEQECSDEEEADATRT